MINVAEIKCVGCTACVSVCPKGVLEMTRDAEGFQYPSIKDEAKCIQCDLCKKVCPVINLNNEEKFEQKGLISQIKNEDIRRESASGGMFSAIALSVLDEDGKVYGAAYDEDFNVCHIGISDKSDLWKLRNSKYVQSNLDGVFVKVKEDLETGRPVCFSGTPCQIEGLQRYLRKDYENLLLVDVVCHGVSSPMIWEKYLETVKSKEPSRIYFRWKHYGYKYSTMSLFDKNSNEIYYAGVETDKMLRAYFSNDCDRDTCYDCVFKKRYRVSDFTIWDCFQPKFFDKKFDDDKGTSCVLVHSPKGKDRLKKIIDGDMIRYLFVSPDELVYGNKELVGSVKKGSNRDSILKDAAFMEGEELFKKYYPDTLRTKMKKYARLFLVRTGLYNKIKYGLFLIRRNRTQG